MTMQQDHNSNRYGDNHHHHHQDEETPLLASSGSARPIASPTAAGHGSVSEEYDSFPTVSPVFFSEQRRVHVRRRRIMNILVVLSLVLLAAIAFDTAGPHTISYKRNDKQTKKSHKKTNPSSSNWLADSALMQLVGRARRNFSKIVVIVVNDQGDDDRDDDDNDQDMQDAHNEQRGENNQESNSSSGRSSGSNDQGGNNSGRSSSGGQGNSNAGQGSQGGNNSGRSSSNQGSSSSSHGSSSRQQDDTNDYIDDDSVKSEVNSKESKNDSGNKNDDSGNKSSQENDSDAADCEPQDWKCWRDKYEKLSEGTSNNDKKLSETPGDTESGKESAEDSDQSVAEESGKNGKERPPQEDVAPAISDVNESDSDPTASPVMTEDTGAPSTIVASASTGVSHLDSSATTSDDEESVSGDEATPLLGGARSVEQASVKSKKATKKDDKSSSGGSDKLEELKKLDKKKTEGVAYCEDGKYSKRTLKLAYEMPFQGLFRDTKGQRKFEASSVTVVDEVAYAICDSSWSISMFDPYLHPFGEHNHQIGDPYREEEDSGYEALFYDHGVFYVVRESVQNSNQTYHAVIEELLLDPEVNHHTYEFGKACPTEFEFEGNSKGFEGAMPIHDLNGDLVVLGLCEGNHCSESKELQQDKGNGRLVAMKQETLSDGTCQWSTIRTIKIPKTAYFGDYSSIDMNDSGHVILSSQEESQLWVGQMDGLRPDGLWDVEGMEFRTDDYTIYDFPKNDNCETMYCNVEGVHWVDDYSIIAVSDKMKGKGRQPSSCFEKDQSAHLFVFP